MSKFNKVLREWRPRRRYPSNVSTLDIDEDQAEFRFPSEVSTRIPADIDDPKDPVFYAIGQVEFSVENTPAEYDRGYLVPGTGGSEVEILDVYLDKIEYVGSGGDSIAIPADKLTKEEAKFASDALYIAAEKKIENIDFADYFDNEADVRADYLRDLRDEQ